MTEMNAVAVGDLNGRHIGRRAIALDGNSVCDGVLDSVWHSTSFKGVAIARVAIKSERGKFELANLPADYLFQIEDDPEVNDDPR